MRRCLAEHAVPSDVKSRTELRRVGCDTPAMHGLIPRAPVAIQLVAPLFYEMPVYPANNAIITMYYLVR